MITIVDYGVGNIGSLLNMFEYLGVDAEATADPERLAAANKLVLPGVGAFDTAMLRLRESGLVGPIEDAVLRRMRPVLGICLGMQLLLESSAEGREAGLGWIPGRVERIAPAGGVKVPNVGWSDVHPATGSDLFPSEAGAERYYFVHSFHAVCRDAADVAATICYGDSLTAAVARGNVRGVQFHPEKSHRFGMRLLKTFAEL